MRHVIAFILFMCYTCSVCWSYDVTTLTLKEKDTVTTSNYPLTFGHVFKKGDVAQYVTATYNGTPITTQCDVKTTYDDGSVRFAVISLILPSVIANSSNSIVLSTSTSTSSTGYLDKTAILATNIEDEVRLTNISGSGYSGSLTADLNATLSAAPSLSYWLQGPVATEVLARQTLNNSIESSWEVRFYPGTSFGPRVSHSIENMNADYRGTVDYNVDIQAGLPTLSSKYSKSSLHHNESSRWRKVLWVGQEPPETELHYNLSYLISTGAVMNYDTSLIIQNSTISSAYSTWLSKDIDLMGNGLLEKYFPTTGGRQDIGILPTWSARYLLSMDNRMRDAVVNSGEMAAHCPIHYREVNTGKSFYRHPISIDDRPTVWTTEERAASYGDSVDRLPSAIGTTDGGGWTIDRSHQGSFAYLPYLITGERYFLDEMYYWASWDLSAADYNSSYGRDYSYGYISDQVRGEAWGFRNLVDAAAYAADSDPEKEYLANKIWNNITKWMTEKDRHPLNYWGVDYYASITGLNPALVKKATSPWMEDFMLLSLAHAREQGFSTKQILDWYSSFIINRFTHPDFNHFNGAPYRFPALMIDDSLPQTWKQASDSFLVESTGFDLDDYPTSYNFIAMAASSTVTEYIKGQDAYNFLKSNVHDQAELQVDPTWAMTPRNYAQSTTGKPYGYSSIIDN